MPEYAIKFLETLKHFFDIKGLYFILMINENHLKKSIKHTFKYINFNLWKDKFIDIEFDLSTSHNQENYIRYLVEKKYNFKDKIDNIKMYIGYQLKRDNNNTQNITAQNLFGKDWASYINSFLKALENIRLNNTK